MYTYLLRIRLLCILRVKWGGEEDRASPIISVADIHRNLIRTRGRPPVDVYKMSRVPSNRYYITYRCHACPIRGPALLEDILTQHSNSLNRHRNFLEVLFWRQFQANYWKSRLTYNSFLLVIVYVANSWIINYFAITMGWLKANFSGRCVAVGDIRTSVFIINIAKL